MTLSDQGVIIKVVLIVLLIILFVTEFFILFAGVIQMIIHDNDLYVLYDGIFMTIVAILVISLSFFGILGAVRENYLNIFVFAGLLGTVLLISLMVHLVLFPSNNGDLLEDDTKEKRNNEEIFGDSSLNNVPLKSANHFTKTKRSIHRIREDRRESHEVSNMKIYSFSMETWDKIHQKFRCCGPAGPQSWTESNLSIPNSCCHKKNNYVGPMNENCSRSNKGPHVYTKGCASFEHAFFSKEGEHKRRKNHTEVTLAVLMRIISYLIQVIAEVLAVCLGIMVSKSRRQEYELNLKKDLSIL